MRLWMLVCKVQDSTFTLSDSGGEFFGDCAEKDRSLVFEYSTRLKYKLLSSKVAVCTNIYVYCRCRGIIVEISEFMRVSDRTLMYGRYCTLSTVQYSSSHTVTLFTIQLTDETKFFLSFDRIHFFDLDLRFGLRDRLVR